MNVEIGTVAAQFLSWEYLFSLLVLCSVVRVYGVERLFAAIHVPGLIPGASPLGDSPLSFMLKNCRYYSTCI